MANTYRAHKARNKPHWYLVGKATTGWHHIPGVKLASRKEANALLRFLHADHMGEILKAKANKA